MILNYDSTNFFADIYFAELLTVLLCSRELAVAGRKRRGSLDILKGHSRSCMTHAAMNMMV